MANGKQYRVSSLETGKGTLLSVYQLVLSISSLLLIVLYRLHVIPSQVIHVDSTDSVVLRPLIGSDQKELGESPGVE